MFTSCHWQRRMGARAEELSAPNLLFLVEIWLTGSWILANLVRLSVTASVYCATQFPLCARAFLPPLASVSRPGGMAFLDSASSVATVRSRFDLVLSIDPTPLADWLAAFSPGLHGEIWLALTPCPPPPPAYFGPRWLAAPCCCWCCWACGFKLGIWDRLSLVTCLPWLASLLSWSIWLAGEKLWDSCCASLSVGLTLLNADAGGGEKSIDYDDSDEWFREKPCGQRPEVQRQSHITSSELFYCVILVFRWDPAS